MRPATCIVALAALRIAAADPTAAAPADENCVKILGYESSGEKQSMDPASLYSGDDAYHIFAAYNRLLDLDDNFQAIPELAESYEVSADGKTWTFHLRKGVKFHDGSDFDSAVVVWNLEKILNDKSPQYDPKQAAQARGRVPT
ncbi:MAG: ABC transporter substrate-binding protein, partial [Dongiaceae bacterium]